MSSPGVNWGFPRKLCLIGLLAMVLLSLRPWGQCCYEQLDAAEIGYAGGDDAHGTNLGTSVDTERADRATSFLDGFLGSFYRCMLRYPPGAAAKWHIPAASGFLLGFFFFRMLDRRQYVKRVAQMSANRAAVDAIDYQSRRGRPSKDSPAVKRSSQRDRSTARERQVSGDWSGGHEPLELPPLTPRGRSGAQPARSADSRDSRSASGASPTTRASSGASSRLRSGASLRVSSGASPRTSTGRETVVEPQSRRTQMQGERPASTRTIVSSGPAATDRRSGRPGALSRPEGLPFAGMPSAEQLPVDEPVRRRPERTSANQRIIAQNLFGPPVHGGEELGAEPEAPSQAPSEPDADFAFGTLGDSEPDDRSKRPEPRDKSKTDGPDWEWD